MAVVCKLAEPLVCSSHDVVISQFCPAATPPTLVTTPTAPRAAVTRKKVRWDGQDLEPYVAEVEAALPAWVA